MEQRGHLGIKGNAYDDWRKLLLAGTLICKSRCRLGVYNRQDESRSETVASDEQIQIKALRVRDTQKQQRTDS